jgi:hypothetical protein
MAAQSRDFFKISGAFAALAREVLNHSDAKRQAAKTQATQPTESLQRCSLRRTRPF